MALITAWVTRQSSSVVVQPLSVSSIGAVIEGHDKLELIGMRCWRKPGATIAFALIDES